MNTKTCMIAVGLAATLFGAPAMAAGTLVKFEGGIGVDPVVGVSNGAQVSNVVHGIAPGGRPWVISRLKADIKEDGQILVKGEGLVFSAGDVIGTPGPITAVAASLFCGAQELDSAGAAIDASGSFTIAGTLNGTPANPCPTPVLLIRNASSGALGPWFAAGVPSN